MDWSGFALSTARGASLAAVLSAFGVGAFRAFVLPGMLVGEHDGAGREVGRRLVRLGRVSLVAALGLTLVWLWLQTATMAGAEGARQIGAAFASVALHTRFGHFTTVRLALLALALVLPGRWIWLGLALSGAALLLQTGIGHAGAMGGGTGAELIASEALHLLAAGAWLGGLLPLLIVLLRVSPVGARAVSHAFTPVGLACVAVLAGTGVLQAWELVGGLAGLVGTAYGRMAALKIAVFAMLLGLATANRFVFTERLGEGARASRRLLASIAIETMLGLLVALAAGRLASLAPSIHEQPIWPFASRPSLEAFADPDIAREVGVALAGLGGAMLLAGAAIVWRRVRWPGLAAAIGLAALAVPHLDMLFVEAYPSSFYTSPTEFGDGGIVHGGRLFAAHCAVCHGADGRGGGAVADLTAEHLWAHGEGDLFWWLSHGIAKPAGGLSMPGFAGKLSSDARWDVLDYVRALNAGAAMRATDIWPHPLPVPQFDAVCAGGRHIDMDDMRERGVLIVAGEAPDAVPPGLTVIQLTPSAKGLCTALGPDVWTVFALLLGVSRDQLAGAQILADRDGWLRARAFPGVAGGWIADRLALARAVADIELHPVRAAGGHHHH